MTDAAFPRCRFGRFELIASDRRLLDEGRPVAVGARALDLLIALVKRNGQLATKAMLFDEVWPNLVVEENNLQVQVSALRRLLGSGAIETVAGSGYRFLLPVEALAGSPAPKAFEPPKSSIAVLPFANLSEDVANEHFADGLAEELLGMLSQIEGLRVTSRTSSFHFRNKATDLPSIARNLNVRHLVEGSVRRSQQRMRITVQLIDGTTDAHVWAGTFERAVGDAFAVQDEIASAIVMQVRPALVAADVAREVSRVPRGGTTNAKALDLYFEARAFARHETPGDSTKAIACYRRALEIDPTFALAWHGLATCHANLAYYAEGAVRGGFVEARNALRRALALEPRLAISHSLEGWLCLYNDWDWDGALSAVRHALAIAPDSSAVLANACTVLGNLGYLQEATDLARRAVALEPMDASRFLHIALSEFEEANVDAAEAALSRALLLDRKLGTANFCLGWIRCRQGRIEEALAGFAEETVDEYRELGLALAAQARGDPSLVAQHIGSLTERHGASSPFHLATAHAALADPDLAFAWLDRALAQRDPRLVEVQSDFMLKPLRTDPRWREFLRRMKLVP